MVKTPRTRHSKTEKQPVTIDLAPGEVSRVKAEAEQATKASGTDAPAGPAPQASAGRASEPGPAAASDVKPALANEAKVGPAPGDAPPRTAASDPAGTKPAETGKATTGTDGATAAKATTADAARPASPERNTSKGAQETLSAASFGRKDPVGPPPRPASRRGGALAGGVAGGVIALLVAGGLNYAGMLPGAGRPAPQDTGAVTALETQVEELRAQLQDLRAAGGGDAALAGRVSEAEDRVAALAGELETLRGEVATLGAGEPGSAPPVDLAPLEERIAALETRLSTIGGGEEAGASGEALAAVEEQLATLREAVAAVRTTTEQAAGEMGSLRDEVASLRGAQTSDAARIEALEQALSSLTGRVDEQAEMPGTALIIAASALKAAIDRGMPFTTELDTYASLAPDAPEIEELRAYAATGVPTRSQIAAESDAAANAMIAAARPIDPQAGLFDRLWGSAMGLVQVRPIGMVEGEDVPQVAARLDAAVQAGDYERAIAEYETLPDAAKAAGQAFMAKVQARHAADRLVDQALATALKA